jgi:uncharacterized repeat protein (TIGR03843 family)
MGDDVSRPPVDEVLARGEMTVHGRIAGSSNATLLVTCQLDGEELLAVYKPAKGERPLWDFPRGLHRREVATYVLSEALGLGCVPETVERQEGPFGCGSVQRFVDEDGTSHYFTLREEEKRWPALRAMAAFDAVINNADRKSGHVLLADDRVWAIDHGLCFHTEPKLRTVIWDFAGDQLPDFVARGLEAFLDQGPRGATMAHLARLLDPEECEAVLERAAALAGAGTLPEPRQDGDWPPYPWPLV